MGEERCAAPERGRRLCPPPSLGVEQCWWSGVGGTGSGVQGDIPHRLLWIPGCGPPLWTLEARLHGWATLHQPLLGTME